MVDTTTTNFIPGGRPDSFVPKVEYGKLGTKHTVTARLATDNNTPKEHDENPVTRDDADATVLKTNYPSYIEEEEEKDSE